MWLAIFGNLPKILNSQRESKAAAEDKQRLDTGDVVWPDHGANHAGIKA